METFMGLVARFRRPSPDEVSGFEDEDASGWSPRARAMTIVGAALASWAVVGAVIYLVGAAIWS
jgi:hypothetical protein